MKKLIRTSVENKRYVGNSWQDLIKDIEENSEYKVDSAYRDHPDQWIILLDKDDNMYDAEVTKYFRAGYELMEYNITPNYQ